MDEAKQELSFGGKAIDTLKMWRCSCGHTITYDLEREIK